jgi:hypothetical protein
MKLNTKLFAVLWLFLTLPLCATTVILVGNPSFEDSAPGYGNPIGWTLFNSSSSPTFTSNARVILNDGSAYPIISGVTDSQLTAVNIDHNSLSLANPSPVIPPDGSLACLVSDNIGTFLPNTLYTLTASLGLDLALDTLDVGLALGTGSPNLSDVFPVPAQPAFAYSFTNGSNLTNDALQDFMVSLDTTAFPSLVGQPIDVSLLYRSEFQFGRVALFDNVNLSSSDEAPEPSTIALISMSGLALLTATKVKRSLAPSQGHV